MEWNNSNEEQSIENAIVKHHEGAVVAPLFISSIWIDSIEIRRFHDANKSGWLALINIVPGIGTFAALIVAGVLKSNYDDNKWLSHDDPTKEKV